MAAARFNLMDAEQVVPGRILERLLVQRDGVLVFVGALRGVGLRFKNAPCRLGAAFKEPGGGGRRALSVVVSA